MTDTRPFDPALFHDAAIDPDTANLNAQMIELLTDQPEWWIVGAQEARRRGKLLSAPVFDHHREGRQLGTGESVETQRQAPEYRPRSAERPLRCAALIATIPSAGVTAR
jgi:hypothetical protein